MTPDNLNTVEYGSREHLCFTWRWEQSLERKPLGNAEDTWLLQEKEQEMEEKRSVEKTLKILNLELETPFFVCD